MEELQRRNMFFFIYVFISSSVYVLFIFLFNATLIHVYLFIHTEVSSSIPGSPWSERCSAAGGCWVQFDPVPLWFRPLGPPEPLTVISRRT